MRSSASLRVCGLKLPQVPEHVRPVPAGLDQARGGFVWKLFEPQGEEECAIPRLRQRLVDTTAEAQGRRILGVLEKPQIDISAQAVGNVTLPFIGIQKPEELLSRNLRAQAITGCFQARNATVELIQVGLKYRSIRFGK